MVSWFGWDLSLDEEAPLRSLTILLSLTPAPASPLKPTRRLLPRLKGTIHVQTPAVGVDCEGCHQGWPLLVQIATPVGVVMEFVPPSVDEFSEDLQRLFYGRSDITKVLCDGCGQDRRLLNLDGQRDVVCITQMANELYGRSNSQRGLVTIASMALRKQIRKDDRGLKYFIRVDNRWTRMPRGLSDIPEESLTYAAADAWLTLHAYQALKRARPSFNDALPVVVVQGQAASAAVGQRYESGRRTYEDVYDGYDEDEEYDDGPRAKRGHYTGRRRR